jgi:hypothetical protein
MMDPAAKDYIVSCKQERRLINEKERGGRLVTVAREANGR